MDEAKLDRIAEVVEAEWPEAIDPREIGDPALVTRSEQARCALAEAMGIVELLDS
jgi:succinylarginine dihydrolase